MDEIWKEVKGYEGYYKISNNGILKSIDRCIKTKTGTRQIKGSIKMPHINSFGYAHTSIYKNGLGKTVRIGRLVAQTFIENPENKPQANHIDGNKLNDNVNNLEWTTVKENVNHAIRTGLSDSNRGENHHKAKLSQKDVDWIRGMALTSTKQMIADQFNISLRQVFKILSKENWK